MRDPLSVLWQVNSVKVLRYLLNKVKNVEEANDIAAETWRRVVRSVHRIPDDPVEAERWLWKIVARTLLDCQVRKFRLSVVSMEEGIEWVGADQYEVEANIMSQAELERHLIAAEAIGGRTGALCGAIILAIYSGADQSTAYKDVANKLGLGPKYVKTAWHRALPKLKELLV